MGDGHLIRDYMSPNHDQRPDGSKIDMLVVHYTGMASGRAALERLCDPEAKVSAHYLIEEDGRIFALVPEDRRAWHAGVSFWAGETDINACSIGIELVNPGHEFGYRAFPEAQMMALIDLAQQIVRRYDISPVRVLGHSDVAPERKEDPGELFDWKRLAEHGVGFWPKHVPGDLAVPGDRAVLQPGDQGRAVQTLRQQIARIGYRLEVGDCYDPQMKLVVAAMQRHFRPGRIDGVADAQTQAIVRALL